MHVPAQAARSELQFSLLVPGRGSVSGALRYFPFEDERETLPDEATADGAATREPLTTFSLTQQPSQALPGASQATEGEGGVLTAVQAHDVLLALGAMAPPAIVPLSTEEKASRVPMVGPAFATRLCKGCLQCLISLL